MAKSSKAKGGPQLFGAVALQPTFPLLDDDLAIYQRPGAISCREITVGCTFPQSHSLAFLFYPFLF
jgi:hypothetical protein